MKLIRSDATNLISLPLLLFFSFFLSLSFKTNSTRAGPDKSVLVKSSITRLADRSDFYRRDKTTLKMKREKTSRRTLNGSEELFSALKNGRLSSFTFKPR